MKRILRLFCGIFTTALLLCVLWGININSSVNETGTKEYIYHDQILFGQKGSVFYSCLSGVYEVKAVIPVTEQDGEEVFNYVSEYMSIVYSQKKGFYEEEYVKDTEKETISRKLGADFGATGISVTIELIDNRIAITANYQY